MPAINLNTIITAWQMLDLFDLLITFIKCFWAFYLLYALYTTAKRHWKVMPIEAKIMLGIPVLVGIPVDFAWNAIVGTVQFWEMPKYSIQGWRDRLPPAEERRWYSEALAIVQAFMRSETLYTGRLSRWEKRTDIRAPIRIWQARRLCLNLNALEPSHC